MLWNDKSLIEELFASFGKIPGKMYEDNDLNEAINYVLFLEDEEQQIRSVGKYSMSDILYGRYYWFTKFLVRYETLYGKDAGMEQQQFKIIEAMDHAGCVDCSLLEKIEEDCQYQDK